MGTCHQLGVKAGLAGPPRGDPKSRDSGRTVARLVLLADVINRLRGIHRFVAVIENAVILGREH
jgi:hypothetical protein